MLTVKANVKKFKLSFLPLEISGDTLFIDGKYIDVPFASGNTISYPNTLVFRREDGLWIDFSDTRVLVESENEYARVAGFGEIKFKILEKEKLSLQITEGGENINFLKVVLDKRHNYQKNRDSVYVRWFAPYGEKPEKTCPGDYVNYNGYFVYKMNVALNGTYDFSTADFDNYMTRVRFYTGDGVKTIGAIVPVEGGAKDTVDTLLLYGDDNFLNEVAENDTIDTCYGDDERFFVRTGNYLDDEGTIEEAVLAPNTQILLRIGDPRIELPLSQDFDTSILQEEEISQFIENESSKAINKIVDYEKQQFIPVYFGKDVEKLLFKIHLRERDENWNTNDNLGWVNDPVTSETGDSVSSLGFTSKDIEYQKKMVSETFLRVSFYTSEKKNGEEGGFTTDRRRQKLLYTAKIFLNSANLYGKFLENVEAEKENLLEDIETEFACTQKYDYENSTEGFYIHLFPGNLDKYDGVIFAKFELNNAKYGKTVPLVLFKNGFRNGYMVKEENRYHVDMEALGEDVYSEIYIRKNEEKGRYEWELVDNGGEYGFIDFGADGENVLTLQLVEPRINEEYGQGTNRQKRSRQNIPDEEKIVVPDEPVPTPTPGPDPTPGPGPSPTPTPTPTPGGSSFDVYFNQANVGRYPSDVYDRDYDSDNFGLTPTVVNTKYSYVTAVFSSEPAGLSMSYKLDTWGGYDSTSFNDRVKITDKKIGMSVGISVNKTHDIRYYHIDYVAPGNAETRRLTVRHFPIDYLIGVNINPTRVDYKACTKRVILRTGTEWENLSITEENVAFFTYTHELHEVQTKYGNLSLYVYYVNFNITENDRAVQREGQVKLSIDGDHYKVINIIQSGNTNAGYDAETSDYVYTIESQVSPSYISEIKEGRKTDFTFTATLFRTSKTTGVKEPCNDWTKYGIGPHKYCKQSVYDSYGYKYVSLYQDGQTENSTVTFTRNDEEFKYANEKEPYCLVGIVDGKVVTSPSFLLAYDKKIKKYTAYCFLFEEDDVNYNSDEKKLTFNTTNARSIQKTAELVVGSGDNTVEYTFQKSVGNHELFDIKPGRYYVIYGSTNATEFYTQGSIKLYRNDDRLIFNNDANTPWKYEELENRVYVYNGSTTYRCQIGFRQNEQPLTKWYNISEPFDLVEGDTFKLKMTFDVYA